MIRNAYGYKAYNHAVFAGVYLGSQLFLFLDMRQGSFVHASFTHFSRMADKEHNYSIPGSTTVSLRLLCSSDFPDAVPFHVTDLEMSPTPPGKSKLRISMSLLQPFSRDLDVHNH